MSIITIIYLILIVAIGASIVWNALETKSIYEKVMGIFMLILLILRLFLIK